jgi:hypothetical protein
MYTYKLVRLLPMQSKSNIILRVEDNTSIPMIEDNIDYQAYLKWLAEGNTPLPADSE